MADDDIDVRAPAPLEQIVAWIGPPRDYRLTRWLILRLLGVVYLFAFLGIIFQGIPLLGEHGLTPIGTYVDRLHEAGAGFIDVPSVLMWNASDGAISAWAYLGLVLSIAVVLGYSNMPMLLVLWLVYGSYERLGQMWFGFGWEIQLLETGLLAAFLAHPYDPRPLAARAPPTMSIVLFRWLAFRIMLGAGLIKLRGDNCWTELTCLDAHFETQPIPNPLSAGFHHLPHVVHATGVVLNHVVELVLPWFAFGPRPLRLIAACGMGLFQIILIISGNLAFLNWLTLIPILACLDDDALLRVLPKRARAWLRARLPERPPRDLRQLGLAILVGIVVILTWMPITRGLGASQQVIAATIVIAAAAAFFVIPSRARSWLLAGRRPDGHQLAIGVFAALVAIKSCDVVGNLTSKRQAMNTSYDRLALVNTYGAFGSVGMVRHELVIEGTRDADPTAATWHAYELPCKPGALDRRPCILGPYHRRFDWLIWFAAMVDADETPWAPPSEGHRRTASVIWVLHVAWKLLDGDTGIRELIAVDPFDGAPPTFVRIRRFVYHLEPYSEDLWWERDHEEIWLPPISLAEPGLRDTLEQYGWPSPTLAR